MTDRQDATVQMFQEEDRLFISEATKIEKEIVLKKHAAQFHSIVFDIAKYMQAQEFDSKGYAIKKKLAKKKLSELMFKLTSAYCSYGIDTKNSVIVEIICDDNISIKANENDIKHLFINLMNNAKDELLHPTNKEKKITIESSQKDIGIEILVKDSGRGVPQNIIKDIFKPHITTKESSGGTGIGLYICRQIVDKYRGKIEVYNDNNGAVFKIILRRV